MRYDFEVTTFAPALRAERKLFHELSEAMAALAHLPCHNAVIFVAALDGGVDCGNFYLFLNSDGLAHVMLHEHREFSPKDLSRDVAAGEAIFLDEHGGSFAVNASLTTSVARAKAALEYWLPSQAQWPEFTWE